MKKLLLASLAATVVLLSGCNTVEGFGQDVASAGDGISNTADHVEKKL